LDVAARRRTRAFQNGQLRFQGDLRLLAQPKIFAAWLRPLFRQDWVVYSKRPFDEFLCRFLLHILPKGFVRIRNFGFLANRKRATLLPLCFQLLGSAQQPQAEQHAPATEDFSDSWRCPKCGGPMKVIERLTAAEIRLRSPPRISVAP
jgi:rubredoxin